MKYKLSVLSLALASLFFLAGCGSSGGEIIVDNPSVPGPNQNIGIAVLDFANVDIPAGVDTVVVTGFDQLGQVAYGPVEVPYSEQFTLDKMSLAVRTLYLDYYDGDFLVGQSDAPVVLSPNGRVTVNVNNFDAIEAVSLIVVPEVSTVQVGTSRPLSATTTLSNGDNFSVTSLASYTSSDATVATVNSRGQVTGVSPGTVTITVEYRDLIETAQVEVTATP